MIKHSVTIVDSVKCIDHQPSVSQSIYIMLYVSLTRPSDPLCQNHSLQPKTLFATERNAYLLQVQTNRFLLIECTLLFIFWLCNCRLNIFFAIGQRQIATLYAPPHFVLSACLNLFFGKCWECDQKVFENSQYYHYCPS